HPSYTPGPLQALPGVPERSLLLWTGSQGGAARGGGERGRGPLRGGRGRGRARGVERGGTKRDAKRGSQPLGRRTHALLPQGAFFPPQPPPLGRRNESEG